MDLFVKHGSYFKWKSTISHTDRADRVLDTYLKMDQISGVQIKCCSLSTEFRNQMQTTTLASTYMLYCYDWYLMYAARTRAKGNDNTISCAIVVSVSVLYSGCCFITFSSWLYNSWTHVWWTIASCTIGIYGINTFMYPYALPIDSTLIIFSNLCLSCNLSQA